MADIRNWEAYKRGRWNWTSLGYEKQLERGCQLGDIDAHLESSGQHLFIECKHWEDDGDHPLPPNAHSPRGISGGQLQALRQLARKDGVTVWLFYGDATQNIPRYLVHLGTAGNASRSYDLMLLPLERRRVYLAHLIGMWQAEADGRPGLRQTGGQVLTRDALELWRQKEEREAART